MDLSNLSTNLPPSTPVSKKQLQELECQLSNEFKNAANSVASLYRLSNSKNSLLRHEGYLDCLDDLLNLIRLKRVSNNEGEEEDEHDVFDIENWCLTRKAELLGGENINDGLLFSKKAKINNNASNDNSSRNTVNAEASSQRQVNEEDIINGMDGEQDDETHEDDDEPMDFTTGRQNKYEFKMNLPTAHKFRPSMPLLSMEHTRRASNTNGTISTARGSKFVNGNGIIEKQNISPEKTVKSNIDSKEVDKERQQDEVRMRNEIDGDLFKKQRIN